MQDVVGKREIIDVAAFIEEQKRILAAEEKNSANEGTSGLSTLDGCLFLLRKVGLPSVRTHPMDKIPPVLKGCHFAVLTFSHL